jgi:hypothetical protein
MKDEQKILQLEEKTRQQVEIFTQANLPTRLDTECLEMTKTWSKTGLLKKLDDWYVLSRMAILLENQRLINEQCVNPKPQDPGYSECYAVAKRCSIPTVRRMYDPSRFIGWDIVSVQPLLGPAGYVRFLSWEDDWTAHAKSLGLLEEQDKLVEEVGKEVKGKWRYLQGKKCELKLVNEDVAAKTRKLKSCYQYNQDLRQQRALEYEVDMVADISFDIAGELSREILTDIRNNVGTLSTYGYSNNAEFYDKVCVVAEAIEKKIGEYPNWIVTSPKIGALLREVGFEEAESISKREGRPFLGKLGVLKKQFTLYEDDLFPKDNLIMGYKNPDNPYHAGYHYCPYVPLSMIEVMACGDGCCWKPGLVTRYAKKLLRCGSKYYGKMVVNGLPE